MSTLITGGAGFIGSTLTDTLLKNGKEVIALDNFDDYYDIELKKQNVINNLNNPYYKLYEGSICDEKILDNIFLNNNIENVVHLAACAGVRNSFITPVKYVKMNIEGTVNLLEKMKDFNVKKIIFSSSSSVYGNCDADKFCEDMNDLRPISPYAVTKLAGEQILYTYSKNYNINSICLRLFTVYGPKQRPDLAIRKFFELIQKNEPISIYGDGTTIRDYTYISDVINGICAAIDYKKTLFEIINIAGGRPITLNEMIEILEKIIGKKAIINYLPFQKGDVYKTNADITKAKELLNYIPQVSFEQGIKNYIQWQEMI